MEVKGQTGLKFLFFYYYSPCLPGHVPGEEKIRETTNQFGLALPLSAAEF